jgi:hypothetical protein
LPRNKLVVYEIHEININNKNIVKTDKLIFQKINGSEA